MIKNTVYLKNGYVPTHKTLVLCNNCNHTINAGPNYKPKFCDMCGAPIKENLDKLEWNNEDASWLDYVQYIIEEFPDYIIAKVKYEYTDYGKIGLPKTVETCPVLIGKDIESIVEFANDRGSRDYIDDDFEPATITELVEYAKYCGKYWKD